MTKIEVLEQVRREVLIVMARDIHDLQDLCDGADPGDIDEFRSYVTVASDSYKNVLGVLAAIEVGDALGITPDEARAYLVS